MKSNDIKSFVQTETCYIGDDVYYTAQHQYNNGLLSKVTIQYDSYIDVHEYAYDADNNKIKETLSDEEGNLFSTKTFEYTNSLCTKETYRSESEQYSLIYEYQDGQKQKMTYLDQSGEEYYHCVYGFDAQENVTREQYYQNGKLTTDITYEYIYDTQDQMSSSMKYVGGDLVLQTDYQYDADSHLIYENRTDLEEHRVYEYEYTYDKKGNLIRMDYFEDSSLYGYTTYEY